MLQREMGPFFLSLTLGMQKLAADPTKLIVVLRRETFSDL